MLEKPILTGAKIRLRPMTADDALAMFASLVDKESMRLTGTQRGGVVRVERPFLSLPHYPLEVE